MRLSENIKRRRQEKKMTQEQLAERLGVSPQAVSKWETSETYPDGALLLPLARELEISLDELFGNEAASMEDIAGKIARLLNKTEEKERFQRARELCWQIEKGLFSCRMACEEAYDPQEIVRMKNSSYLLGEKGFTVVSNGREPFFALFPQPEEGYGFFLEKKEELLKIFKALSQRETGKALIYLYKRKENFLFESAVLERECGIPHGKIEEIVENLTEVRVVTKKELTVNGEVRVLYESHPRPQLLAVVLMAKEIGYQGAYSFQAHCRNTPLLRE